MAPLLGDEREVVRDALLLFKGLIAKNHLSDVSKLPRNGKSASTSADDKEEELVINRLKDVDKILSRYANSDEDRKRSPEESLSKNLYQLNLPADVGVIDTEPYVNPFTGLLVYPDPPNAPGPSKNPKQVVDTLRGLNADIETNQDDQAYRNALRGVATWDSISDKSPDRAPCSGTLIDSHWLSPQMQSSKILSLQAKPPTQSKDLPSNQSELLEDSLKSFVNDFEKRQTYNSSVASRHPSPAVLHVNNHKDVVAPIGPHTQARKTSRVLEKKPDNQETNELKLFSRNPFISATQAPKVSNLDSSEISDPRSLDESEAITSVNQGLKFLNENRSLVGRGPSPLEDSMEAALILESEERHRNELIEADAIFASTLSDDMQQDIKSYAEEQQDHDLQVQIELEALQRQLQEHDRQEVEATMAQLQAMQDEWNLISEESLRQQQTWSQQIVEQEHQREMAETMRAMRSWQEMLDSAEAQQIEADRLFALSLAEEYNDEQSMDDILSSFTSSNIPGPSNHLSMSGHHEPDGELFDGQLSLAETNREETTPMTPTLNVSHETENITDSFGQAKQLHEQWQSEWQSEINTNAQAAQAIQKEIEDLENQARRDLDFLRHEIERRVAQEEEERQETERQRKARMVECNVCGDEADRDAMFQCPCSHAYCGECLNASIDDAMRSKKVFHCCGHRIDLPTVSRFVSRDKVSRYTGLVEELETPNPVYCSRRNCSAFISPRNVQADTATCGKCGTQTCINCKRASHAGVCAQDREGQALLALGQSQRWKSCPRCKQLVERASGCLHMTCRCGKSFCYNCGEPSSRCSGTCAR